MEHLDVKRVYAYSDLRNNIETSSFHSRRENTLLPVSQFEIKRQIKMKSKMN